MEGKFIPKKKNKITIMFHFSPVAPALLSMATSSLHPSLRTTAFCWRSSHQALWATFRYLCVWRTLTGCNFRDWIVRTMGLFTLRTGGGILFIALIWRTTVTSHSEQKNYVSHSSIISIQIVKDVQKIVPE